MSDRIDALNRALAGTYEVEREIGQGGMAVVYLARDLKHDRHVALKSLRPELASSVGAERFLREIQLSARLSHPHILTLIDSGQAGDVLYFVLPYVEGESLRQWIDREGALPLHDAVRMTEQVASALTHAHELGVVHRDIKPENILIHQGEAQVSDFGIAVGLEAAKSERLTVTGTSIGSPAYMSPEQIDGTGEFDHRSDIYALGCLAYEMLAGRPPFRGESTRSLLAQILTGTPDRLDALRAEVPKGVADAVARAIARDPADRFPTAADFARALAAEGSAQGAAAPPATPWYRRPLLVGPVAALLAFLAWQAVDSGPSSAEAMAAVDRIEEALANADFIGAYRGLQTLPDGVDEAIVARLMADAVVQTTIRSEPEGARAAWRPLLEPEAGWDPLGSTPVTTELPNTHVLVRLELEGHETRYLWSTALSAPFAWPLRPVGTEPANALWVPGDTVNPGVLAGGIWQGDARPIGDFLIDRFEVTNTRYQEFVDAGGYERPELWEHDFVADGRTLDFEEAMALFVDRTGRPGPSTWEVGRHPDGMEDHPVTGVSWYEAAAYARFVGRSLPTMYHFYRSAYVQQAQNVVPLSNLEGRRLAPVGEFAGLTVIGASDMAGNAREWMMNAAGPYRLTQGGGWSDAGFSFGLAQPLDPFDRSEVNGFRLISDLGEEPELLAAAGAPVAFYERDFGADTPVSDETFEIFLDLYAYSPSPLNAAIEATDTVTGGVIRQRISFDAAYDGPRMVLYLFLPPGEVTAPLQTVVYFPGSGVLNASPFDDVAAQRDRSGLISRSGRAFAYPVYLSSFERDDDFVYPLQDESNEYREQVIRWYQDMARSIDYLETRPEIDMDRLAYMGNSLGSRMGAIMLGLEPRFRTAVLNVAGLSPKPTQPVVDPFNFASRVSVPVLVISGEFDPIYPLEMSARPFFEALGGVEKEHYVGAGAHFLPWPEFAQQTLGWLDRHLGPVR